MPHLGVTLAISWSDLDLELLWKLWAERELYLNREASRANSRLVNLGEFEKSAW